MKDIIVLIGKPLFDFYGISYDFLPSESRLTREIIEDYLERVKKDSKFSEPGGCMLNIAERLVNSKRKVFLAGGIGDDNLGEKYKKYMKKRNINSYLKTLEDRTGITINSLRGKCWYYYGASEFGDIAIKEYSEDILQSDRIIVDAYSFASPHKFLLELLEEYPGEKYLILSGCKKEEFMRKYTPTFNFLKEKEIEFEIIFGNFEEWASISKNLIPKTHFKVITYPWGCKVIDKNNKKTQLRHRSMSIKNIYTIGAGDTFTGTFISFYIENYSIKECAKEACKNSMKKIKENIKRFQFWK